MLVGRIFGYLLIGLSVIMASADAVVALGPAEHVGIMTADVVVLLMGDPYAAEGAGSLVERLGRLLLATPAWTFILMLGAGLVLASRHRPRRHRFRRA